METNPQLRKKLKQLLIGPAFIGDLPELYRTKFQETLSIDEGLLKFVDSCDCLRLQGSYVEYCDSKPAPVVDRIPLETLDGRLKFLLPSARALFYEDLPHLYRRVFGETFECGSDLLHFIESHPHLEMNCHVFVKYSDSIVTEKQYLTKGNSRHKQFLTRRFIFLLKLFPKSSTDLIKMYKERFGEDLPVHPRILPAIFRMFLKDYFVVSTSNMIYFALLTKTSEAIPELPPCLLEPSLNASVTVLARLLYLKHTMKLESRYLQFMYYDIFGEPIEDLAELERFIRVAYTPSNEAFELALVWVPGSTPSSIERVKELLSNGPMTITDLFNACSSGGHVSAGTFRRESFPEFLLSVPGVLVVSETVRLADGSLDYVHIQLQRLVDGVVKLSALPSLFKKAYGYMIPDDYVVREYVLHSGTLLIDGDENVVKLPEIPPPSASTPASPPAGNTAVSSVSSYLDAKQKSNVRKLLEKKATRLDRIREEYRARFNNELKLDTKLSAWLQTVEGICCDLKNQIVYSGNSAVSSASNDLDAKQKSDLRKRTRTRNRKLDPKLSSLLQTVEGIRCDVDGIRCDVKDQIAHSAKLSEAQAQVIALLLERNGINFEDIPAEFAKRFKKVLVYEGSLKPWLCSIPGITIGSTKMCTYGGTVTGGSMQNLSEKKLNSNFSKSTPDIRPRSQEELIADLIVANPGTTINNFLKLFAAKHGKQPSYKGKLKTYLVSIPGVQVDLKQKILMQPKDVATNAKQNICEILKQKNWVCVDEFADSYKKLFGVSANETWIQSRQKEIDFLMFLNNKIRYEVLSSKVCLQYVKHLANLCNGVTLGQLKSFFPVTYGFTLPKEMYNLTVQSHPTGKIEPGPAQNIKVEIWDHLKSLSAAPRKALLHLTQKKSWTRIEDLLLETCIVVPSTIDDTTFCESLPSVAVKNSRVKFQRLGPTVLSKVVQNIVSWLKVVHVSELPMLIKRLYGFTVKMESIPLDDLKLCASIEETAGYLRSKPPQPVYFDVESARDKLFSDSDNQLHRFFMLVAANPNIELGQLETLYKTTFDAPIIHSTPSFKMYVEQHPEFSVINTKVTLTVTLSAALKEPRKLSAADLSRNLLSAQVPATKAAQCSKLSNTDIEVANAVSVRPTTLAPNIVSSSSNAESSDSRSNCSVGSPEAARRQTNLTQAELGLFDSLIGDRDREIKVLCNDYKNKFKTNIVEDQLEKLLLAAGYCCVDGKVHRGCRDRLRFLLSVRELDQTNVIIEFGALFARSPCYVGTLRRHLLNIGCVESTAKRFRFPTKGNRDREIEDEMLQRLLPIIGFPNKSTNVSVVLEEYNNRHDPPLTQATLQTELQKLDFVILTKKKGAFDCGGIHEASAAAIEEYTRVNDNTLSYPDLAEDLPAKTGEKLMYFGNLVKALQKAGFNVSNDVVSFAKPQNTTVKENPQEGAPSVDYDLTEIRAIIKELLRENSPMKYDDLEAKFREAIGYNLTYSLLGCSDFSSFLRVYLPDDGMVFDTEVVTCTDSSDASRNSSSRTSPSRSTDLSYENVFDVIQASGPLLYPSELQARFKELTGSVLSIPDPDLYLAHLLRAMELIVKSDHLGNIRLSKPSVCGCEEEQFVSAEEEAEREAEEEEWKEELMNDLAREALLEYLNSR